MKTIRRHINAMLYAIRVGVLAYRREVSDDIPF